MTDSQGRHEFYGLPCGSLGVAAIERGVQLSTQRLQPVEGGSYTADFVIPDQDAASRRQGCTMIHNLLLMDGANALNRQQVSHRERGY